MQQYINSTLSHIRSLLIPSFFRPGWTYSIPLARADIVAGLTVALIQVPQSMAFALIAGLPAVYGLYASLPGFLAGIFGSSRYLSTGPVAIVSFLTFTSLVPLAEPGSATYIALAETLALLVGLIYITMGAFRLGFILQLVPHSVVVGFSSAAAAIIIISQIPNILGISIVQKDLIIQNIVAIITHLPSTSFVTLALGLLSITFLYTIRRLHLHIPGALIVLVLGIYVGYVGNLVMHGVAVVGTIIPTLPLLQFPSLSISSVLTLIPKAAIIALVGYVGTHATAKSIAKEKNEHIDTNQELVGQGIANIVGSFFQSFPLSGSFTRTAVNVESGARTELAALYAALFTVFSILFLSSLFLYVPKAVLAAIVIVSALPLIHLDRLKEIYRVYQSDGYIAWITFAMAFILKPDDAIYIGVVVALMLFIKTTVWDATVVEVGLDKELGILRGEITDDAVDTFPHMVIARIGMSIYYANAAHITHELNLLIKNHEIRDNEHVTTLILAMSGVTFIDITGIEELNEYFKILEDRHIRIITIYLRSSVKHTLSQVKNFPHFTDVHTTKEMIRETQRRAGQVRIVS